MRILVSACLLGINTRYDGKSSLCAEVLRLSEKHTLVPVCPEQLGGLPTPRTPCEVQGERALTETGQDLTEAFQRGAEQALAIYHLCGCHAAVLKQNSPSCSKSLLYDGTFQGKLIQGTGMFTAKLLHAGAPVYGEDEAHLIDTPQTPASTDTET